jgi:hypothetical protein
MEGLFELVMEVWSWRCDMSTDGSGMGYWVLWWARHQ